MMTVERVVYVVDDDAAVRRSLERLLDMSGIAAVSFKSGWEFLDAAACLSAGCVLLDLRMPGIDGLELQARLRDARILLPVIVMTGQGDVPTAVLAMKAGAVDFIEKPYRDQVLLDAIEAALASALRGRHQHEATKAASRIARLSRREREVLDALVSGHPNKVIAYNLGISVRTVEVHRARMMDRLGVRQLADAIRLAVLARLVA